MALQEVNVKAKKKGGGGLFGKIAGGVAGVLGAPFTIGASLAAIPTLSSVGGMLGEMASRTKVKGGKSVPRLQAAQKQNPDVQLASLLETQRQINSAGQLNEAQKSEALGFVNPAIDALKKRRI